MAADKEVSVDYDMAGVDTLDYCHEVYTLSHHDKEAAVCNLFHKISLILLVVALHYYNHYCF